MLGRVLFDGKQKKQNIISNLELEFISNPLLKILLNLALHFIVYVFFSRFFLPFLPTQDHELPMIQHQYFYFPSKANEVSYFLCMHIFHILSGFRQFFKVFFCEFGPII